MEQRLLLVDDEPNVLKSLGRIFLEDGYTIYTATSGKDALDILATTPIQVIISDQRMPQMTGAEFLTQVNERYPHTVRIILSAHSDFNALKDAINNGAIYKFVNKPWDIGILRMLVRDAFKQKALVVEFNDHFEPRDRDPITGLPDRFQFNKQLDTWIAGARLTQQSIAVVLIYLDGFDKVVDISGEITGDKLLRLMAERLKQWSSAESELASLGRGKFCFLLHAGIENSIESLLQALLIEINNPLRLIKTDFLLHATIGVSFFPAHGDTYYNLLKHAELAREHSRKLGDNSYQLYNESLAVDENGLISEVEVLSALENNEFLVHYQPIVSAKNYHILGAEALVRWMHPKHGLLSPDTFIPLCEETGLIINLGTFVLQKACEQLKKWHQRHDHLFVSVNISPRQLRDVTFLHILKVILASTRIPPHLLELELTENVMMYDMGFHIDMMQKIAALSVKLSIDDFGTGYSSLSYLKLLPINKLKIDKSFVQDVGINKKSEDIIQAIIALAKILELTLVAEGVEKMEQLSLLKQRKCEQIQGFIFSNPVTADEFERLLENPILKPLI